MLSTELKNQRPSLKKDNLLTGDLSTVIEIGGKIGVDGKEENFQSLILYSFPMDTYLKMASAMLMSTYTEYNEEVADVGKEIANIVMTNVKKDLKDMGYNATMNMPTVILGTSNSITYPPQTPIVVVPLYSDHGPFIMEFCYKEG